MRPQFRFSNAIKPPFCFNWVMSENSFDFGNASDYVTLARMMQIFPLLEAVGRQIRHPGSVQCNMNDLCTDDSIGFCSIGSHVGLIPDQDFVSTNSYVEAREFFREPPAWSARSDVPFWRGSSTGHREGPSILDTPRAKLCRLGNTLGYDFKITSVVQAEASDHASLIAAGLIGAHYPWQHLSSCRYNIDIDGNTSSWSGLFLKLLSGGVVLKVASKHDFRQWYYNRLVPGVNIVSVDRDLKNLASVIENLRSNPDEAEAIANEGRALAYSMSYDLELQGATKAIERFASMEA